MRNYGCKFVELAVGFFKRTDIIGKLYIFFPQFVARLCNALDNDIFSALEIIYLRCYKKDGKHTGNKKILVEHTLIRTAHKNISNPLCMFGYYVEIDNMQYG